MQKAYTKTNWQNLPSKNTALGATNLNKLENGVNTIDDRVIALDVAKADQSTVNTLVKTITFNETTGIFTITLQNGSQTTIDTALEKIAVNFAYNSETQQIELTLIDGTVQYIDVSDFITNVDFETSETIQFLTNEGKTKAKILDGSVTDAMLQPNYLADITVQAENGLAYSRESKRYAVGGVEEGDTEDNAKYYKTQAELFKNQAEVFRNEAEGISGVGIATEDVIGLVKGSGAVNVAEDGSMWLDPSKNKATGLSGESIIFNKSDNALVDITKIEGSTTVTPANPLLDISPDNVATITSAKDFDVVACGKNLLRSEAKSSTSNGIIYTVNSDGSITANGTSTAEISIFIRRKNYDIRKGTYTLSGKTTNMSVRILDSNARNVVNLGFQSGTFTVDEDLSNCYAQAIIPKGRTVINETIYPQIELGSNPTPYEPYKSNKLTIAKELNKLENGVADTRERIDDKYVKYTQRIGKEVFDGSQPIFMLSALDTVVRVQIKINNAKNFSVVSSHLQYQVNYAGDFEHIYNFNNEIRLYIDKSRLSSPDIVGTNEWLQSNPVTVLYELATPIETIVEEPSTLTSYKGVTNVFTTATAQPKLTVDFKSEFWARNYLQDKAISGKIDNSTPIEFVENKSDVNIVSGDNLPTLFGKILKSINTFRDGLANKISTSKIVNTTAVTEAGFVPDALLVKTNAEAIDTLNNNSGNIKIIAKGSVSGAIDLNTLTSPHLYRFDGTVTVSNWIFPAIGDATMLSTGGHMSWQLIITNDGNMYYRGSSWNGIWSPWYKVSGTQVV